MGVRDLFKSAEDVWTSRPQQAWRAIVDGMIRGIVVAAVLESGDDEDTEDNVRCLLLEWRR